MELAFFTDRRCLEHDVPWGFPESPARLRGILREVEAAGLALDEGEASAAGVREAVEAVHGHEYVERLQRAIDRGDGLLGSGDNPLSAGTGVAAWAAAATAVRAAAWAVAGDRHAFAAVRPPGHHAERRLAMGFCYFNNVAVAVEHLRRHAGCERLAVFDFDVHHGNGTQAIFYDDPQVLYASVHQYPFYPGTGAAEETGAGEANGATVNVPLAAGCGDPEYARALERRILPALREFHPDLLLVSAGFDAWRGDPLGGMRVSAEAFGDWGCRLGELAAEVCGGRVVSLLEGGYDLEAVPGLVVKYARAACGAGY